MSYFKIILFCLVSYLGLSLSRLVTKVRGTGAYEEGLKEKANVRKKLQDVDGKISGWESTIPLLSKDSVMENTTFVGLVNVEKEYLIKFSFKPKNVTKVGSVLNLFGGGRRTGDGGPSFFVQDSNVIAVTFIDGKQRRWNCSSSPKVNEWNDIEFSQERSIGNQYIQKFTLNGAKCGNPVVNMFPGLRTGVSIYVKDPWHKVCDGSIRNLIFSSRPQVRYGHMKVTFGDGLPFAEFLDYGKFIGNVIETIQKPPKNFLYSLGECLKVCHKSMSYKAVRYTYTTKQCNCVKMTDNDHYKDSNTDLLYMLCNDTTEQVGVLKKLQEKINKYLVFPYPKPDVDGEISDWENVSVLPTESNIVNTTFLGLVNVKNEYLVKLSFKPTNIINSSGVVLNLYGGGRRTGDGGPSFFVRGTKLIAVSFINGKQSQWNCSSPKVNEWNDIEFSQERSVGNQYFQMFLLNGVKCADPTINRFPGLGSGASIYVNDPWHKPYNGSIRNLIIGSRPQVKYGHLRVTYGNRLPFAEFLDYGTFTGNVKATIQRRTIPYSLGECLKVCLQSGSYNAVRYTYTTKQCYCINTNDNNQYKDGDTDLLYMLRNEPATKVEVLKRLQDATNKYLVFPYPKTDVDGKISSWENVALLSTERIMAKTTFVRLVNVKKEYLIKFSFKPKNVTNFGVVLDLSAHSRKTGDGGPSFFLQDNHLIAVTFINGKPRRWNCSSPLKVNEWYDIEFSQERSVGNQYFQKFTVNGAKCGNPVVNMFPGLRTGVSIYVKDPWHKVCDGSIRNLIISSRPQVKYGHMMVTFADGNFPNKAEFLGYGEFTSGESYLMQPKEPRKTVPYSLGECLEVCHKEQHSSSGDDYQNVLYKYNTKQCYCVAWPEGFKDNNSDLLYKLHYGG